MKPNFSPTTQSVLSNTIWNAQMLTDFYNRTYNTNHLAQNLIYQRVASNQEAGISVLGLGVNEVGVMLYALQTKDSKIKIQFGLPSYAIDSDNSISGYVGTSLHHVVFSVIYQNVGEATYNYIILKFV